MKIKTVVYGVLSSLALCAAFAAPASAACEGPFATVAAVMACQTANATHPTEVYVDGGKVGQVSGSGSPLVRQYFNCASGIGIAATCNHGQVSGQAFFPALHDGYSRSGDAFAVVGYDSNLYLDDVLVLDRGKQSSLGVKTCHGDQSVNGRVTYFVVEFYVDGFGSPLLDHDCF